VSSALVFGAFLAIAVRKVLQTVERRRGEAMEEIDQLREAVQDLGWQVDCLHEHHTRRLHSLEQRLDFTEQVLRRPAASLEARH